MTSLTKKAFTLIEVLLVVAIIGVVTAVTTPYFVRSIRGNRLRVAARTVVMAGRYARSMAVLRQEELRVRFDLGTPPAVSVEGRVSRTLDQVTIAHVILGTDGEPVTEGTAQVLYQSNGRCTPYEVKLTDIEGRSVSVHVDALSTARTESEF
ncbi:MAG: prepilin-type N-terminal cleavage/methylation domain-containing protein [Lentisphaerae bacterium]|nr:prepilin-type N-terminal cleavage/methylation domain-containing protein [Lentisphaerota bacterium]